MFVVRKSRESRREVLNNESNIKLIMIEVLGVIRWMSVMSFEKAFLKF